MTDPDHTDRWTVDEDGWLCLNGTGVARTWTPLGDATYLLMVLNDLLDKPCPHIVTDGTGTSHCALAESCADGGDHRGAVLSLRHQRDALRSQVEVLEIAVRVLHNSAVDRQPDGTTDMDPMTDWSDEDFVAEHIHPGVRDAIRVALAPTAAPAEDTTE